MSQFIEMFGNPLSSIQKNELKKLGDCCQINPRRPSVSISDSDLVSFVPMPAVNEDGYIDGATNEEYGKVKKGFTYFENNDVLFAKITPCMENGKGAIAEALTNGIGMGSTEFHVLRPKMVKAFVPLAEMFGYSTDLRSKTQGRGNYSMFFEKYEPVPKNVQEKVLAAKAK